MYFWNCGLSFSDKIYKTVVVVHLPNSRLSQVLTSLTLIWGSGGQNGTVVALLHQLFDLAKHV